MLDNFTIFARGGIILFSWSAVALKGSPIDALIQTVLLEERSGQASFHHSTGSSKYTLKWTFNNDLGLIFVAVYQSILQLLYVDELLNKVRDAFSEKYRPTIYAYPEFVDEFQRLMVASEKKAIENKKSKQLTPNQKGLNGSSQQNGSKKSNQQVSKAVSKGSDGKGQGSNGGGSDSGSGSDEKGSDADGDGNKGKAEDNSPAASAFDISKLKKRGSAKKEKKTPDSQNKSDTKKGKVMRVWDLNTRGSKGGGGGGSTEKLDFTSYEGDAEDAEGGEPASGGKENRSFVASKTGRSGIDDDDEEEESEEESEEEEEESQEQETKSKGGGWLSSVVRGVVGTSSLSKQDLEPLLEALHQRLITKNVAAPIAQKLCDSVGSSLEGKRQGAMTRVSTMVKEAMTEALTRILTPKRSTDVLREVQVARERGAGPYTIVFIGVNGVGKSTNLAKVAYWLLQHDVSVMIAACDTFRAGAVEQLRTHCRRLEQTSGHVVPLFERGYEKDPASVALEARKQAARDKVDVLLVDTAGRMQDNKPLMEALAKLVDVNKPELCLFVGEALVGNDAVDQLKKFNGWLTDLSTSTPPRLIDGIVLTKFDTVDEKVGAALSMVYESGAPIMFVGCGQTYTDIRKLNVRHVVNTLLS